MNKLDRISAVAGIKNIALTMSGWLFPEKKRHGLAEAKAGLQPVRASGLEAKPNDSPSPLENGWARGPGRKNQRCPKCASIVYSRKSEFCGVCGISLPQSFRFSETERAAVISLLTEERERHRAWLTRRQGPSIFGQMANAW